MKRYGFIGLQKETRQSMAGFMACVLALSTAASAAFEFTQSSEPLTFFTLNSDHEGGSMVTSQTASLTLQGYRFAYWKLDGVPQRGSLGNAYNPFSFIITHNTEASAVYLLEWQDNNTNSLPDWWEWNVQGELVNDPIADTDGDGFILAEEYRRDTNPRISDQIVDAGFSMGLSKTALLITDTNFTTYSISSDPPGYLPTAEGATNRASIMMQADAYGMIDDMRFACWELNGNVVTDALGRAVSSLEFSVQNDDQLVARYLPQWQDDNTNGLPDWWEWNSAGKLVNDTSSDTDSDGFSLAEEYRRDTNPHMRDQLWEGGNSLACSANYVIIVNTNFATVSIESQPPGLVEPRQFTTNRNAQIALTNDYTTGNFHFCHWKVNGTIQTDPTGRAVENTTFTLQSNTIAQALYVNQDADSDNDGVADWFEYHFTGDLSSTSNADGDADGFGLETEYGRDYHAGLVDELRDGGISHLFHDALVIMNTNLTTYSICSDPPGYVPAASGITNRGTVIAQQDIYGTDSDMRFACWELNGNILTDALGRAVSGLEFTVQSQDLLVARYLPQWQDSNTNGLPDWWEWNITGGLVPDTSADTDGDGLSLEEEYRRDTNPLVADQVWDGGISTAYSEETPLSFAFFIRTENVLIDGITSNFFTKVPPGMGTLIFDANSHPALGDWDGDGDLDLFVGGRNGVMRIFENAGSPLIMNLVEQTTNISTISFAWTNITNPAPALGDWSGDGLTDLAIGGDTNVIQLIPSDGSWTESPSRIIELQISSATAIPAFGKIDADPLVDLLVLTDSGEVDFFPNTGNSENPYFESAFTSNLLGIVVPDAVGLTTADVNEDEITDILVSDQYGNIWEFHGRASQ
ncbi:FG-GAP-like repeat-containing protein [Pontiellaceae bacterium B12227]|nr:FG-GAP-like repeat-containing protein [Pontiellaceae bacterium B12227]